MGILGLNFGKNKDKNKKNSSCVPEPAKRCPQCGFPMTDEELQRCPRCNSLLRATNGCGGCGGCGSQCK